MSRRGTIKQDDAGRWGFVVDVAMVGAPRKQVRRRGFRTKRDAQDALDELKGQVRKGTFVRRDKATLRSFVEDEWLPAIRSTVESTTHDSYTRTIEHVLDHLGDAPLQSLDPAMLNETYARILESGRRNGKGGLAPRTVRYTHTILRRALRDAERWGRVVRNIADLADPPSAKSARSPEMNVWTPEQLRSFLGMVASERLFPAFRLAAMTGARRGEVFGLKWADVDLGGGRVTICRQLRNGPAHAIELVDYAKSAAGRRTVDIDPETVSVLKVRRRQQREERLKLGAGYRDQDLVFAAVDGSPTNPERAAEAFDRRVARSGLPRLRFHDLRHTHASHLIAAGQHAEVISKRLGHASPAFTLSRYGHLMPGLDASAASAVAALVDGAPA